MKTLFIYGTRPEAIKLAPVIAAIEAAGDMTAEVCCTGQHRYIVDRIHAIFGIKVDFDLDIMVPGQSLAHITAEAIRGLDAVLAQSNPDVAVVQGDTTSALAGALGAFYCGVPVVHVEAGLRSHTKRSPFPEEVNRRLIRVLADVHLAPTLSAAGNLLREQVDPDDIFVTGNTVVDAVLATSALAAPPELGRPFVLATLHRRENWGSPIEGMARAIRTLAGRFPEFDFVLPLHPNPAVRAAFAVVESIVNIRITEPSEYVEFVGLMRDATLILTDSGGVQEEAPTFGTPVLVLRAESERLEGIESRAALLVGTDENQIVRHVTDILRDRRLLHAMSSAGNPYGDGAAAQRTVAFLRHKYLSGERPDEFRVPPK